MPQPGAAAAGAGGYPPYPTSGNAFPSFPTANNNSGPGGYPPYPMANPAAAGSSAAGGYPPCMNFPAGPGYNSGYVNRANSLIPIIVINIYVFFTEAEQQRRWRRLNRHHH